MYKGLGLALGVLIMTVCLEPPSASKSPNPWETVQLLYQDTRVLREKVSYRSSGLKIFGQVCRPNRSGQFPVVVWNHGGFEGLQIGDEGFCQAFATFGYTLLMSSYRGEDGSEGSIEVCNGEVDDVLRLLELGRTLPYANPKQVVMMGGSHGGCISLRAVQKGAPARVLIDFYDPSDWQQEYQHIQQLVASSDVAQKFVGKTLDAVLLKGLGGTPTQVPQAYRERSPSEYATRLGNWSGSILMIHGANDWFVPPNQSCTLARAIGGFTSYRIGGSNLTETTAPSGCEAAGLIWHGGAVPRSNWQDKRYLLVYDNLGHGDGSQRDLAIQDALDYILTKVPVNPIEQRKK